MCCPIPTLPSSSFESRSTIGISEGSRRKSRRSPSQREFQLWPFVASDFLVDLRSLLMETGKMPSKLSALLIFLLIHTCMIPLSCMFNVCYMPCIWYKIGHPTVEIHNSYIKFCTIIWSAPVHQHYLSFLAADFARNKEKETLQKHKSQKGPEGYPNSLPCELLLDTLFRP